MVFPKDLAQYVADFPQGSVTFHGFDKVRHQVFVPSGRLFHRGQSGVYLFTVSLGLERRQVFYLSWGDIGVGLEERGSHFFGHCILIEAHHDAFVQFDLLLDFVGPGFNLPLNVSVFNG